MPDSEVTTVTVDINPSPVIPDVSLIAMLGKDVCEYPRKVFDVINLKVSQVFQDRISYIPIRHT